MASAISIYSGGRFSINYYCCSRNPGELKTNKRTTTQTGSLGAFKNSFISAPTPSRICRAPSSGRGVWILARPPQPRDLEILKHLGADKWVGGAKGGGRAGAGPGPAAGGLGLQGGRRWERSQPGKQRGRRCLGGSGATSGVNAGAGRPDADCGRGLPGARSAATGPAWCLLRWRRGRRRRVARALPSRHAPPSA